MKKIINTSFLYAILAMIGGVFYREFTKFNHFVGKTTLSVVHTHLFMLGMFFFLVILLLAKQYKNLIEDKKFKLFYYIYNGGLLLATAMFVWRGVLQVLGSDISSALNASISGMAGIGHILLAVGIIIFFTILKKQEK
ncbi:DUF2871 domain-containing protein [Clostridium culturomicium]|uniref:DUF2871 domain-containing protein n=1 Tax=Clostridium culturomicium TaxID=1499683 RepID=UPI0005900B87|nr:DUF2871 domain-containing protein [Clostridium culturomicium]